MRSKHKLASRVGAASELYVVAEPIWGGVGGEGDISVIVSVEAFVSVVCVKEQADRQAGKKTKQKKITAESSSPHG